MAIVKMSKFALLTFEAFKEELLQGLQIFENVHFRDLQDQGQNPEHTQDYQLDFLAQDSSKEAMARFESEISKIRFIMDKMKPFIKKPKMMETLTAKKDVLSYEDFNNKAKGYDYSGLYELIRNKDERLKSLKAEKNKLKTDNDNLNNWLSLDVSSRQAEDLKSIASFIGVVSKTSPDVLKETIEKEFTCCYVEVLNKVKDEAYVMVLGLLQDKDQLSMSLKNLGFTKTNIDFRDMPFIQIEKNNVKTADIIAQETEINSEISKLTDNVAELEVSLDYYTTLLERAKSCEKFLKFSDVVIIEGWVPTDKEDSLDTIVKAACGEQYYLDVEKVHKDCPEVPIKLKNNTVVSAFESITTMYSIPRYNEIDPTPLLTPFYILFFGIMVGDMAYGLILMATTFIALKFLTLGAGVRNFVRFLFILSFAVFLAGMVYGSAFGVTVFTPIADARTESGYKAILDTQLDIITMMLLAIAIGVLQVVVGVLIKAYMLVRDGQPLAAVTDALFWIIALLSGIGIILGLGGVIPATAGSICGWAFMLSLVGLALTQGRHNKTIVGKVAGGLFEVYGITGYIGDLVSYTRLVALALAGAYIALSFNLMVTLVPEGIMRVVFGTLIFVLGHTLNLALGILGAYVHSCRLQYVEYFGKFYEGGGKAFNPLKLMNKTVNIQK